MSRPGLVLALLAGLAVSASGCSDPRVGTIGGKVRVVAAENFWGSIARQLGGVHAQVQSLIVNPAQDPHSYEPTTSDARAMATAQLAIVNGVGYDPWAPKLLAANPVNGRATLTVGQLLRLHEGDNPHRWYDPAEVTRVARTITADLQRLDPPHKLYFAQRLSQLDAHGLADYHRLIAQIRRRFHGVPVGASESIFALQAPALGLDLITPPGFMKAISEGTEVTAQDTITTERQLAQHRIKVWVYNSQNVTPEIQRLNRAASAAGIPTVTVTETLSPASDSFQQWQVAQLARLRAALHQATGR
ncbi:MAG TPA: zinc ABC transporter substrate-binding protein [Solirubrobacteraceae bacterium]|nr:zinc ABC transporter substrate-binding protein [Solirubrobacteraceae bacterium]